MIVWQKENIPFWLAIGFLQTEWSIGLASLPSELGQRITDAFDNIDEVLNELDWYLLPIDTKKILPLILINTQDIVALKCFGSILCGREAFKNVSKCDLKYQKFSSKIDLY